LLGVHEEYNEYLSLLSNSMFDSPNMLKLKVDYGKFTYIEAIKEKKQQGI